MVLLGVKGLGNVIKMLIINNEIKIKYAMYSSLIPTERLESLIKKKNQFKLGKNNLLPPPPPPQSSKKEEMLQ